MKFESSWDFMSIFSCLSQLRRSKHLQFMNFDILQLMNRQEHVIAVTIYIISCTIGWRFLKSEKEDHGGKLKSS